MLIVNCSYSFAARSLRGNEAHFAKMKECADNGCRRCLNAITPDDKAPKESPHSSKG